MRQVVCRGTGNHGAVVGTEPWRWSNEELAEFVAVYAELSLDVLVTGNASDNRAALSFRKFFEGQANFVGKNVCNAGQKRAGNLLLNLIIHLCVVDA